jgi:ferritin heavy chain
MEWLEKYLIIRGGRCKPTNIEAPKYEWPDSPVEPVGPCREAFNVQRKLFVDLEKLCTLAEKCQDTAIVNAIESRFLRKHAKHLKNMGDLLQQVTRVSKQPGLGLYHLDAELRHNNGCIPWMSMNDPDIIEEGIRAVSKKISGGLALQTHHEGTKLASKEAGHC